MLVESRHELACAAIQRNLVARLEGEGLVSKRKAAALRIGDIGDVFDEALKHCSRLLFPMADGTMIVEHKESKS